MLAPAGKSAKKEIEMPIKTDNTDNITAAIIASLNPLTICRAVTAGKINKAETSITPTTLVAKTTVMAVKKVRIKFILLVLIPDTFAYSSSKVVENKSLYNKTIVKRTKKDKPTDSQTSWRLIAKILPNK